MFERKSAVVIRAADGEPLVWLYPNEISYNMWDANTNEAFELVWKEFYTDGDDLKSSADHLAEVFDLEVGYSDLVSTNDLVLDGLYVDGKCILAENPGKVTIIGGLYEEKELRSALEFAAAGWDVELRGGSHKGPDLMIKGPTGFFPIELKRIEPPESGDPNSKQTSFRKRFRKAKLQSPQGIAIQCENTGAGIDHILRWLDPTETDLLEGVTSVSFTTSEPGEEVDLTIPEAEEGTLASCVKVEQQLADETKEEWQIPVRGLIDPKVTYHDLAEIWPAEWPVNHPIIVQHLQRKLGYASMEKKGYTVHSIEIPFDREAKNERGLPLTSKMRLGALITDNTYRLRWAITKLLWATQEAKTADQFMSVASHIPEFHLFDSAFIPSKVPRSLFVNPFRILDWERTNKMEQMEFPIVIKVIIKPPKRVNKSSRTGRPLHPRTVAIGVAFSQDEIDRFSRHLSDVLMTGVLREHNQESWQEFLNILSAKGLPGKKDGTRELSGFAVLSDGYKHEWRLGDQVAIDLGLKNNNLFDSGELTPQWIPHKKPLDLDAKLHDLLHSCRPGIPFKTGRRVLPVDMATTGRPLDYAPYHVSKVTPPLTPGTTSL